MLVLLGVTPAELTAATLTDLDDDLEQLTVGTRTWPVPTEARPALAALRTTRTTVGADDIDLLLADLDGTAVGDRAVANIVTTVPRELGFRVDIGQVDRTRSTTTTWARRRGVRTTILEA